MSNDLLSSLKWNEMKKIHNNLRRTHAVLSIINAHILPSPFLFLSSCVQVTNLLCGFTTHFKSFSMPYKVRGSGSFNHFMFSLKKHMNAIFFLIFKQVCDTISITHQPFSLNK